MELIWLIALTIVVGCLVGYVWWATMTTDEAKSSIVNRMIDDNAVFRDRIQAAEDWQKDISERVDMVRDSNNAHTRQIGVIADRLSDMNDLISQQTATEARLAYSATRSFDPTIARIDRWDKQQDEQIDGIKQRLDALYESLLETQHAVNNHVHVAGSEGEE